MMTKVLSPAHEDLAAAAAALREGALVAFPTETVYGLGANALLPEAASRVYAAKGRPSDNPLIVHIAKSGDAERFAFVPPSFYRLSEAFMPGPLTVILPKRECIPYSVTGGLDSVGLRVPDHEIARELIERAGVPICAPSANLSGRPSPTRVSHVLRDLDGRIDYIIDGGACEIGVESTIVKLDNEDAVLLRPGKITVEQLRGVIPNLKIDPTVLGADCSARPLAPGMAYRHYAPNAALILLDGADAEQKLGEIEKSDVKDVAVLRLGDTPEERMANLYNALRAADRPEIKTIYAAAPDKERELALYNRMTKAADIRLNSGQFTI